MDQILTTKLNIPQLNVDIVPRAHLYTLLDECLTRRLSLVSAPTGFGKSTLVTEWLSERDLIAAWLSLDSGDNDLVRFWTYLIAALQTTHPGVGTDARKIVSSLQRQSSEPAAISLINDISRLADDIILVLDDYHVIEDRAVHAGLSYLLEHQPPNFHIILVTRVDPPISLARLRVHSQLTEVRAEDLQFSNQEAAILFNEKMGLNIKPEHIEALNAHTESWVVGLQLAGLSLRGKPSYDDFIEEFTGGHQFIVDYLTEEVLVALPDALRDFLLTTSILERFCIPLCQAVTGEPSCGQMLHEIQTRNLFLIPLDTEGRWFRYHHLFAEVLSSLLERDRPNAASDLHLKAAQWLDTKGYYNEAVDHALLSGDMFQVRELILKHWMTVLHRGEVATLLRWLDALPEEINRDDPFLSLARCWALFLRGQSSAIEPYLDQAADAYKQRVADGSLHGAQQDHVAAQLAMMRSVLARNRGDHTESVAHAEEAAHRLPEELRVGIGTKWNMLAAAHAGAGDFDGAINAYEQGIALAYEVGNFVGAYGCIYGQAMYLLIQGRLNDAENLCRSAIDRAINAGHGNLPAAGALYITLARVRFEQYQLEEAEVDLETGMRIARPGGFTEAERTGRYLRAQLSMANGDTDTAAEIFRDTERILNILDDPYLTGELNGQWAAFCLRSGDHDTARGRIQVLEEKLKLTKHANLLLWWSWLYPRLLHDEGRYEEARTVLPDSLQRARTNKRHGELIHLLALQAAILDRLGERLSSRSALYEAIELGAPGGYVWRWLDAGPGIEPLLRELRHAGSTSQVYHLYLDTLLDACRSAFGGMSVHQPADNPDTLTPREMEILRLISRGYSNPEIASELVVTINTIKKHTSNIYSKLGVRSRTQAIARAHELNLVLSPQIITSSQVEITITPRLCPAVRKT